jgi:hypothetical protein
MDGIRDFGADRGAIIAPCSISSRGSHDHRPQRRDVREIIRNTPITADCAPRRSFHRTLDRILRNVGFKGNDDGPRTV